MLSSPVMPLSIAAITQAVNRGFDTFLIPFLRFHNYIYIFLTDSQPFVPIFQKVPMVR